MTADDRARLSDHEREALLADARGHLVRDTGCPSCVEGIERLNAALLDDAAERRRLASELNAEEREHAKSLAIMEAALDERDALRAAVEGLRDELQAFDCVADTVPSDVDVPDDFEHGLHDAAHRLTAILAARTDADVTDGGGL